MKISLKIFSFLILLSVGTYAFAQEDEDFGDSDTSAASAPARPKAAAKRGSSKRTEVNFEDQLIKGEVQKPELFYLLQKKQFNFSKLIKLRENFLPEMKKTAEDVPRGVED